MSVEDDYIDHVAQNGSGFLGGLEDEGLQHLDDVGLLTKTGLPSTLRPEQQAKSGRCGAVNQDGEPCICTRWRGHKPPHRGPSKGAFYGGPRYEWTDK